MRKCPNCGNVYDDSWKICLNCEATLITTSFREIADIGQIDDAWVINQTNVLLQKCPYVPTNQKFLLEPNCVYGIADPREQFVYLMKRYDLPVDNVAVYLHEGLEKPGKVEMVREYDTSKIRLEPGQKVVSIKSDGKVVILDSRIREAPRVFEISTPLSYAPVKLSVYLCQDYILHKEVMAAIVAHELSHLYLFFNGIQQFQSTIEISDLQQEYITDIAVFVLGLGSIMLNGCAEKIRVIEKSSGNLEERSRVGYLSFYHMQLVQKEVLKHKGSI